MAYSDSVETLKKILPVLQPLAEGKTWRWAVPRGAKQLAYKIREALYIASHNPEAFPELARAAKQFRIEIIDRDNVQAVLKRSFTTEAMARGEATDGGGAFVVTGMEMAGKPHELVAPSKALEVIQFWMDGQPSNGPFTYPRATLDMEEMTKLYNWASARNWLVFYAEQRITLHKHTRDLAGMEWTPADGLDDQLDEEDLDLDNDTDDAA